ncbi:MAG: serine hydrolase, partial [Gemmatimonadetes bacterium]|nr:beta-lactamase family protein [Gemmatimonadota bacterium]NIQ54210.1 beta-lactamase family protein [Gemmatimonadota bacterium]NIU74413.1 serine hydrolase [Gammaproteobacteria bacterium]NIX44399.1 serine hydrolase [Gemmatimonadota bacterium]NIY08615.1 serine hydrolase [Gemmatimonadota bacterium]
MGRTVDGVDRRARSRGERSEARGLTGRVRAWRRSRRIGTSLLTVLALAATSGCDETEEIAAGGPTFDVDLFEQNIRDALDGETVGYAYAISEHGQLAASGANGFARTAVDGQLAQSAGKRTNIASVTKTITAVAVLQLLERRGLTIDSDIDPWIPADWTR